LYGALLEEARFFGIDKLEKWLSEQKYLEVVRVAYSVRKTDDLNTLAMTVDDSVEIAYDQLGGPIPRKPRFLVARPDMLIGTLMLLRDAAAKAYL
jgi:hypothetical protein